MAKIRVGIIGVGNCASSLVQGVEFYAKARDDERVPGLMNVDLGGYHIKDIEFVCAFDVDSNKVGLDLSEAIWKEPNNTVKFSDVPETGIKVQRGHTYDGLGTFYRDEITESELPPVDVARILKDTKCEVLINYLPVGSEQAARFYAEQTLDVIADDRDALARKPGGPVLTCRDEDGHAVDEADTSVECLLGIETGRLFGPNRQVVDEHVAIRVLQDPRDVDGR